MNREEVVVAIVVADTVRTELNDDYVGLWIVPWHVRRALPSATEGIVRDLSEMILTGLLGVGAVLGDLDGESGLFIPWPASGAIEAAMDAWRALGRDPNIGDVGWLARSW